MKKHVYVPVLKALIYGNAGAGKTTLASSVLDHPDMSPVFYLNAAGNPVSLFAARGPYEHVFDIERMEDLSNVYSFLRTKQRREDTRKALGLKDGETFKTIVIDTISEVQQMQIKMLKNWDGDIGTAVKMSPQDWGEVLQHITNLAGMFYRLPNINVVMVAQEKEIEDKMLKLLKYSISLQGQAVNTVAAHANQVFRLYRADGKSTLYTQPTRAYYAKCQGITGLEDKIVDPSLADIYKQLIETHHNKETK
jgi:hypothetical protein